jgi:hypothetical protein
MCYIFPTSIPDGLITCYQAFMIASFQLNILQKQVYYFHYRKHFLLHVTYHSSSIYFMRDSLTTTLHSRYPPQTKAKYLGIRVVVVKLSCLVCICLFYRILTPPIFAFMKYGITHMAFLGFTIRTIVREYLQRQIARCVLKHSKYIRCFKTTAPDGRCFSS